MTDFGSGGCHRGGRNVWILHMYTDKQTYTHSCVYVCVMDGRMGGLIDGWMDGDQID